MFLRAGRISMTRNNESHPLRVKNDRRKAAAEVNRLARIVQGTMSLEGQGLDLRSLHRLKNQMFLRMVGPSH
jgi:hypothetical protein